MSSALRQSLMCPLHRLVAVSYCGQDDQLEDDGDVAGSSWFDRGLFGVRGHRTLLKILVVSFIAGIH